MPEEPRLSIIVPSYNSRKTIERCLESLKDQNTNKDFEIIVVDSSTDDSVKFIEERFPKVRLYRFSERKFAGGARNFGISAAKADIIAFIDADCTADRNWVDEILKAHQSPHLAIGGSITNANPDSYIGWASYFCEFSQWMPNSPTTLLTDVAGANMSYKRKTLEEFGYFIEGTYCSDTDFHWRLQQRGYRLRFMPSILVRHHNINSFKRFLGHEYNHGRDFAQVCVKSKNFSKLKRFIYAFCFSLIAVKLFLKISLINFENRIFLLHFFKALPLLMLGLISWSFGECVGYVKARRI